MFIQTLAYSQITFNYNQRAIYFKVFLRPIFFLTYCSSAATYPLRGLVRCVFRDALLHTTVAMSGYLHYCYLPVSFDQSGHSPVVLSHEQRIFDRRPATHWIFFVLPTIL